VHYPLAQQPFVVGHWATVIRALLIATVTGLTLAAAWPSRCEPAAPRADHHQHLQGPNAVELANRILPSIVLPDDVARLLHEREDQWNQASALEKLFTESSQVFTGASPGWAQGARRSAEFLSRRFARPYRLTPTAARFDGRTGWVTGYYTRGEGTSATRIGYFHLSLEKADDGRWHISSEAPIFPGPRVARVQDARDLIQYLDAAGIRFGVVLSEAYFFDSPKYDVADRLDKFQPGPVAIDPDDPGPQA